MQNVLLTGNYLIHLLRSVLLNQQPAEKPDNVSFEELFKLSYRHNVLVMTFLAVDRLNQKPEEKLLKKWNDLHLMRMAQGVVQLHERDRLYGIFEKNNIPFLPMKGCILKDLYPLQQYREMADLDILVRSNDREKVCELMEENGYTCKRYGIGKNDVYTKDPYVEVEIHINFYTDFGKIEFKEVNLESSWIMDPWSHSKKVQSCRYCLSDEDFYVFLVFHLAKHYMHAGAGIRQILDLWIYRKNVSLDEDYIYSELDKMNLKHFCINAEKLAESWMEEKSMNVTLTEMEEYVLDSGSYGNANHSLINDTKRIAGSAEGKVKVSKYILAKLFPSKEMMKHKYPVLNRYPMAMPAVWIYRLITKGIQSIPKMIKNIKTVSDYSHVKEQ